jgi:outer membrane protein TolC
VNQPLYDGGVVRSQKKIQEAAGVIEEQKLEVELYKLKDRVNQLFFGVLLVDLQVVQIILLKKDLQTNIDKTEASINNGVALKSNADVLKAELLKANQRITELKAARKVYCEMLGMFINKTLDDKTKFVQPEDFIVSQTLNRPELILFDQQSKTIDLQHQQLKARNMPKFSLFAQGGYGRPALNPLNNKFDTYYLGGIRMNWSLTGFYTFKNDKALLEINRRNVDVQKELFVFNTNYALKQQSTEVDKYRDLLSSDSEIISLRTAIKTRASAQLENGVISASDFLRELNAEEQAKEARILHEVQLLLAQYNQQTTYGSTAKN